MEPAKKISIMAYAIKIKLLAAVNRYTLYMPCIEEVAMLDD